MVRFIAEFRRLQASYRQIVDARNLCWPRHLQLPRSGQPFLGAVPDKA